MSEPRKNHLSIDGGQVKEDEHVATYKTIPDADADFKTKPTLSKSKEKISDEAEEKLLDKEEEAKIVTRVDMADAKYVVGDHRNGDAKIELDANKRQFSGLTKEELLKYADDPFWVRLRWAMFVLFWALWLAMLAGAIAIIVRAPKCAPPPPKTWFEKGPLVEASALSLEDLEQELPLMESAKMEALFVDAGPAYDVLDDPSALERFKRFCEKAAAHNLKVIVDLVPNFVTATHDWFIQSLNRTAPYDNYFYWAKGRDFVDGERKPPNNWVSTLNTSAWTWSEEREEFYLHQFGADSPDLNFHNPLVVAEFDKVLKAFGKAGAIGVRLQKVRLALVNQSFPDEEAAGAAGRTAARGADHASYAYYRHRHSRDQPALDRLLAHWAELVGTFGKGNPDESVFTIGEESSPELFLLSRNLTSLRPRSATPLTLRGTAVAEFATDILRRLDHWPAIQLKVSPPDEAAEAELSALALLLPAAPVLPRAALAAAAGNRTSPNEKLSHLVALRADASIEHGEYVIAAAPADNGTLQLLAIARWKPEHTGYVGVFNPHAFAARADLRLRSVPRALTVHHASRHVQLHTNYTMNVVVESDNVLVPPKSTVVLSYVPEHAEEQ